MSKNILITMLLLHTVSAHAFELKQKYDTKGHPKAKGAWVTVRYPQGWEAREGERPNIVQKFSGHYKGYFVTLMLQILDAGKGAEAECRSTSAEQMRANLFDRESNQIASNVKKTTHERKPAFIYDLKQTIERAGKSSNFSNRVLTVCHGNLMINSWCGPMIIDSKNQTISSDSSDLVRVGDLCFQYFNSVVLMDSY